MAKPFWNGVISFGMVAIPVKMYVATQSKTTSFHFLHKKCLTRPKQVLYCAADDEYFSVRDTVRGYEYAKEQYMVIEEGDFKKLPLKTTHTIDILEFVDSQEIDPIYYYGSHYLEPEELGTKPFFLLWEALLKTNRVGLAKVTFQRREHLCCLRPLEDILALHTMHYPDEILTRSELVTARQEITHEELEMATSLVTMMSRSFRPEEYKDEYHLALQQVIEAKISGETIKVPKVPKKEVGDLMSALRASIEAARTESAAREKATAEQPGIRQA